MWSGARLLGSLQRVADGCESANAAGDGRGPSGGFRMKKQPKGLGDLLVQSGLITTKQLEDALEEQRGTRERLGQILYRRGLITQCLGSA
jgi:hypothetical protein